MKVPKVSVIIPSYNVAPYLETCVNSILTQTMPDFELIIINDGSTDLTAEVMDKLARIDSRIRLFSQENQGPSGARNVGIGQARGEYVCFVDGDDVITENMLEEMCHMIEVSKADVCIGGIKSFRNLKTVPKKATNAGYATLNSLEATNILLYEKGILNSQCAKLYKRSVMGDIRFDSEIAFGEDMYFNYNIFKAAKKIVLSSFTPYYYLQRSGSVMRASFNMKRADSLLVAKKIQEDVKKRKDKVLKDAAINKLFTESVAIAGLMPLKHRRSDLYVNCMQYIEKNKSFIFHNARISKKNKVFSGITIVNKGLLINLLWVRNNVRRMVG